MKALTDLLAVGDRIRYTDATPNPQFRGLTGTITQVSPDEATVQMDPNIHGAVTDFVYRHTSPIGDGIVPALVYIQVMDVTIHEDIDLTDIL